MIVGPALDEAFWPAVGVDDAPGIEAAVEHLVGLGHRRIAHVSGPLRMVHGRSRRDAWEPRAAARRARARPPRSSPTSPPSPAPPPPGRCSTYAEPPTAIVYANDLMAMAGMAVAAGPRRRDPRASSP